MSNYIGSVDSSGNQNLSGSFNSYGTPQITAWDIAGYVCPGSGPQNLVKLGVFGASQGFDNQTVNIAIYDSTGTTKIAETGPLTLTGSTNAWHEGTVSATLTGGTTYLLAFSLGGPNGAYGQFVAGGPYPGTTGYYVLTDYSSAMPSSLPAPAGTGYTGALRGTFAAGAPTLSSISPAVGNHGATTHITLTGTNFDAGCTVGIDGTGVTVSGVTFTNSTTMSCDLVATSGATGVYNVHVTGAGGTSGTQTFTINTPPHITSITADNANPGDTNVAVVVTGTGLASAGLAFSVTPSTGITIHSVVFTSSVSVQCQIDVDSGATPGFRSLKVTQTVGGDSNSTSFQVNGGVSGGGGGGFSFGDNMAFRFA